MIYVAVCTPSGGFVRGRYAASLVRMMDHYRNNFIKGREDEEKYLSYHMIESSTIASAREWMVRDVLEHTPATHLLFIDDDMGFRETLLNDFLAHKLPIVGCNYRIKIPPCNFTVMGLDHQRVETDEKATGLVEVEYMGFGFTLIERIVLVDTKAPRFEQRWSEEWQTYSTEDRPFYQQARSLGYKVMMDHDASKKIYHMGNFNYSWDLPIPAELVIPRAER